jgi:hypothetical protein
MRDRSVSTVATGREDHIASCHAPSVSVACALPPLPVWLLRRPAPASLLAARFTPSPLSHATFASGEREGERERRGFSKKGENSTREKNEKRKRGKGQGKKKKIGEKEINCLFFINCVLKIIVIKLLLGNWT